MVDRTRRRFVNWFLGTTVGGLTAAVVYPVFRFVSPPDVPEATTHQVEVGSINDPELLEKGYKIVRFGNEPVIVLKAAENDYRAFAATCTHLDCIVEYRQNDRVIWCNCHDGQYDLTGRNVAGPPPRPLESFKVHLVQKSGEAPALVVERA
ncbi:MAG TPA: ubiquinol-cytochrome c reductase iron-sulfur subunit [Thermoanaerobaculia bacterium]|nr:ubiquinol-cytochrome c reductase iron-sulfur subunit [Thermoanaerobaculia bacterium]